MPLTSQEGLTEDQPMNALLLELPDEAKFMLALKLFEVGRLSSAKAGLLCGMGRVEFLLAASRAGVPVVAMDSAELNAEFAPND